MRFSSSLFICCFIFYFLSYYYLSLSSFIFYFSYLYLSSFSRLYFSNFSFCYLWYFSLSSFSFFFFIYSSSRVIFPSSFCFYFYFSFSSFIFSNLFLIYCCRRLDYSSSCCFFRRLAYSSYSFFFSTAFKIFGLGLLFSFSRSSLLVDGRFTTGLFILEAALLLRVGAVSLSYSKFIGSSLYFLTGRGGRMALAFFTTLASSKNLTYSSKEWNLYCIKCTWRYWKEVHLQFRNMLRNCHFWVLFW